jgi:hypothetical protein
VIADCCLTKLIGVNGIGDFVGSDVLHEIALWSTGDYSVFSNSLRIYSILLFRMPMIGLSYAFFLSMLTSRALIGSYILSSRTLYSSFRILLKTSLLFSPV